MPEMPVLRRQGLAMVAVVAVVMAAALPGCALLPARDPPRVNVVGVEPLPSQGLELRMQIKLRVLNPNDAPIEYNGVYVGLNVRGQPLADGASGEKGVVPRFGETILTIPVTVPAWAVAAQALGIVRDKNSTIPYELHGKLSGPMFGGLRFESRGEFKLPMLLPGADKKATGGETIKS